MRFSRTLYSIAAIYLCSAVGPMAWAADQSVATAVYARLGNGYKRSRQPDGSFKPEYYAISNGGRVAGTTSDVTVDRVTYPEVAEITMRLLAGQNYHYAKSADEATLLLVLYWGSTISFNRGNYDMRVQSSSRAFVNMKAAGGGGRGGALPMGGASPLDSGEGAAAAAAESAFESEMLRLLDENRIRDSVNLPNARLLGYLDAINEADGIQRYAGGGTRYDDLITDVEESRYYIIVSAYDFHALTKQDKKKLLWTTRVSVRVPGNRFDDSAAAMLKSASKYFGQDSGKLIRGEEIKGNVELGDVKFLGEAKEPAPTRTKNDDGKPEGK